MQFDLERILVLLSTSTSHHTNVLWESRGCQYITFLQHFVFSFIPPGDGFLRSMWLYLDTAAFWKINISLWTG